MQDLSNQVFGIYKVLEQDKELSKEKKRVYWKCQCLKCNNIVSVRADGLKRNSKNCKLCKYPNLIGQRFGQLTVIERAGSTDNAGHIAWVCQCDCGNKKTVLGTNLVSGKTLSCGCLHKEITSRLLTKDLTGQTFGQLRVLERDLQRSDRVHWICECSCGTKTSVAANNLTNGHTQSCGCIKSKGEQRIREILNNYNIPFKTEYVFQDLPNRRFDFAIYNPDYSIKTLIEFDGKQHYSYTNTWHKSLQEFENSKMRDQEKTEYCQKNDIPLIRIPYYDIDKIKDYLQPIIKEENS